MVSNSRQKETIGLYVFGAILIFMTFLGPQVISLAGGGFSEELVRDQIGYYWNVFLGFFIGIFLLFQAETLITKDDAKYKDTIGFFSPGEYPAMKIFKRFTHAQIVLAATILFGFVFLIVNGIKQQTFTGVTYLQQAFTPVSSIFFSELLVPASENMGLGFLLAFIYFIIRIAARRYKMGQENYGIFIYVFAILLGSGYGYLTHIFRYGFNEVALFAVLIFWGLGALMSVAVGSFIPFWVLHIVNNLFIDITRFFDKGTAYLTIFGILVVLVAIYYFAYFNRWFGDKTRLVHND